MHAHLERAADRDAVAGQRRLLQLGMVELVLGKQRRLSRLQFVCPRFYTPRGWSRLLYHVYSPGSAALRTLLRRQRE